MLLERTEVAHGTFLALWHNGKDLSSFTGPAMRG